MKKRKKTNSQLDSPSLAPAHLAWHCGTSLPESAPSTGHSNSAKPDRSKATSYQNTAIFSSDSIMLETLSFRKKATNEVIGSASTKAGTVELYAEGVWRAIGEVDLNGRFSNANVPENYLLHPDTIRARVTTGDISSHAVEATADFVHARARWFGPTANMAADQDYYQWRLRWADYQPTGYRMSANSATSIWLEGDDEAVWVLVGVQGLANQMDRASQTENMRETRLKRGRNTVSDPLGGLVHIRNNGRARCHIVLDGSTRPIPFCSNTYPEEFIRMLEKSDALSEVQLAGDRVVITSYADTYRNYAHANPNEIITSHEKVLSIEAMAAGLDGSSPLHTRSNMWIHAVEAASTVMPSATTGYIALPHGSAPGNEYMTALLGAVAHRRWVTLHEYGHHFQNRSNSPQPLFDENSVNIYALAVGRVHENDYSDEFPRRWPALKTWLAQPRDQKTYSESPDTHAIFEQLRKAFGDDFLPKWDRYTRENPVQSGDLITFTTSLSKVANCNLADFFAEWGVIKPSDPTWNALQALNLSRPPADLTKQIPYT
ncbi:M60 family metallopeptidase [Pseudomonas sp. RC10]|uniref:M60 family metallopeptidase n=1 Tax=Pseudomonas bambusae TaxID=3139142 RepID=UPI003139D70D